MTIIPLKMFNRVRVFVPLNSDIFLRISWNHWTRVTKIYQTCACKCDAENERQKNREHCLKWDEVAWREELDLYVFAFAFVIKRIFITSLASPLSCWKKGAPVLRDDPCNPASQQREKHAKAFSFYITAGSCWARVIIIPPSSFWTPFKL